MNVIHISMDTLKRTYLGCYGSDWVKTPNIDRFASQSLKFTNAYCASFPCMPARRDFLTGRYEFPFRGWGPLDEDDNEIPLRLKKSGTVSCLVSDHFHLWESGAGNYHMNFDSVHFIRGNEADMYSTDPVDINEVDFPCDPRRLPEGIRNIYMRYRHTMLEKEEDWFAPRVFNTASEWLEKNKEQKSFYMYIDNFTPHEPFDPPPEYVEMYDPDYKGDRLISPNYCPSEEYATPREVTNIKAHYAGNITHVDKWFGKFMEKVEELGFLENTMIILNTDHGTYTGDHGWLGKTGTHMYDCISHIPYIVYHPDIPAGECDSLVSNVDICPTIMDGLGRLDADTARDFHGESLIPLMKGEKKSIRNYNHFGRYGNNHGITDGRFVLHLWHDNSKPLYWYSPHPSLFMKNIKLEKYDGTRRRADIEFYREAPGNALFDLANDPNEENNLIDQCPEKRDELMNEARRFLSEIKAPSELFERLGLN